MNTVVLKKIIFVENTFIFTTWELKEQILKQMRAKRRGITCSSMTVTEAHLLFAVEAQHRGVVFFNNWNTKLHVALSPLLNSLRRNQTSPSICVYV